MKTINIFLFALIIANHCLAQCMKDFDCKGDRICVQGKCIDPPTKRPPCTKDVDCRGDSTCENGRCVALNKKSSMRSSSPTIPPNYGPSIQPTNQVAPGGYIQNPAPGAYTQNPAPGGYTQNPVPGGYTQNPAPGGYIQNPAPGGYTQNPAPGGYTQNPAPGGYIQNPAPGSFIQYPVKDCETSKEEGKNQAKIGHSTTGWEWGGAASGFLGGLIGTGVITGIAAISSPTTNQIPNDVVKECYQNGYTAKARSKNIMSALTSGLEGTLAAVIIALTIVAVSQ
jgi:hypothetical protein